MLEKILLIYLCHLWLQVLIYYKSHTSRRKPKNIFNVRNRGSLKYNFVFFTAVNKRFDECSQISDEVSSMDNSWMYLSATLIAAKT